MATSIDLMSGHREKKYEILENPRYFCTSKIDCEDVENLPVGFRLCYVDWLTVSDGDRFA